MGLSDITNRQSYIGDGSSTVFPFPHYFFSPADLIVNLFDTNSSIIYPQILNTNYSISGNVNSQGVYPGGGNVVMASAFPSNLEIVIVRAPSEVQTFALAQNQPINSLALVQQLDYLTALIQRQQDLNSRSLGMPDGIGPVNGSTFSMALPAIITNLSSAGQVLALNSGASGWTLVTIPGAGAIIPVSQGGTGQGGPLNAWGIVYAVSSSAMANTIGGAPGQVLVANSGAGPSWGSVSIGSGAVSAGSITGILAVMNGGTNNSSFTQGQLVFASNASTLASLPGTAGVDQVFVGLAGSPPLGFSAINLASGSSVQNILPVGFGGTGTGTSYIQYGVMFASSATQLANTGQGPSGVPLVGKGAAAPTFQAIVLSGSGAVTGVLPVTQGGTGSSGWNAAQVLFASTVSSIVGLGVSNTNQPGQLALRDVNGDFSMRDLTTQGIFLAGTNAVTILNNTSATNAFTLRLPNDAGGAGKVMQSDGAGNLSWISPLTNPMTSGGDIIVGSGAGVAIRLANGNAGQVLTAQGTTIPPQWAAIGNIPVATKTAAYTATNADSFIIAASGCNLINLFGPPTNTGSVVRVKKTATSPTDIVTITCSNGSIDGSSVILYQQYDQYEFVSDGTNWQITDHYYNAPAFRVMSGSGAMTSAYNTIQWKQTDFDPLGMVSGGNTATINRTGKWKVSVYMIMDQTAVAGDTLQMRIVKSGSSEILTAGLQTATSVGVSQISLCDIINLKYQDQLIVQALNNNTNPSIQGGSSLSWFSGIYLGP